MDNDSAFVPYDDEDPFLCPLIPNLFFEVDPALVLPKEQPHQQCDHPSGPQHVPLTIQNQLLQDNNNNNIVDGGEGVANFEVEGSGQTMHGGASYNIINEGGVGNFEVRATSTMGNNQPMLMHDNNNHFSNGGGVGNLVMGGGVPYQTQPPNGNMAPPFHQEVTSYWPLIPRPFFCTCCQVLRQIIHTNGVQFEKLEIHGTIGVIGHAIIQNRNITQRDHPSDPHQFIDFHYKNTEQIKSFVVEYCAHLSKIGYIIVEDVLSTYYEILCTGVDWAKDTNEEDIGLIPPNDMGRDSEPEPQPEPEPEPEPEPDGKRKRKRPDAEQRKRIKAMKLEDCSDYFHLTIGAAARKLDVCVSALKGLCRRNNLEHWPQRKLTSNMKKVRVLKRALDSPDSETRAIAREQIKKLQDQVLELCVGIKPTGIEMVEL